MQAIFLHTGLQAPLQLNPSKLESYERALKLRISDREPRVVFIKKGSKAGVSRAWPLEEYLSSTRVYSSLARHFSMPLIGRDKPGMGPCSGRK